MQLQQSLTGLGLLQEDAEALVKQCEQMIGKLDRTLLKQARELGWGDWIERCQAIPGVGPLTAMALVASWSRGQFRSADAFIAFLELDVRVKQSMRWQGRCKLTNKGDGEVHRLLYNAAMRGRGMSSTEALVALSRKLAKVSFAMLCSSRPLAKLLASRHGIYPPRSH